jgi:hypothetical protein
MIDELSELLDEFPGSANRTRCFTHIINLVAKSIMKQFDLPKARVGEALDAAAQALATLSSDIEREERSMEGDLVRDEEQDDNNEGLVDIRQEMSDEEITALDKSLQPVRLVLAKVSSVSIEPSHTHNQFQIRKLAFTIKNSTTIVLPEWRSILEQHAEASKVAKEKPLSVRMMPRDVSTRWNSTFDMVEFALLYRKPLDDLTSLREMKLRVYELSEEEWRIAEQLSGVLKVSYTNAHWHAR